MTSTGGHRQPWVIASDWEERLAKAKFNDVAGDYATALQNGLDHYVADIYAVLGREVFVKRLGDVCRNAALGDVNDAQDLEPAKGGSPSPRRLCEPIGSVLVLAPR